MRPQRPDDGRAWGRSTAAVPYLRVMPNGDQLKLDRESPGGAASSLHPSAAVRPAEGPGAQLVEFGIAPLRLLHDYLPARRLPLYLGGGALLVVGMLELPVVVGVALGYEALRVWTPPPRPGY